VDSILGPRRPSPTGCGCSSPVLWRPPAWAVSLWTPSPPSPTRGSRASGAASTRPTLRLSMRWSCSTGRAVAAPRAVRSTGRSSSPSLPPWCGLQWKRRVRTALFASCSCQWRSSPSTGASCWLPWCCSGPPHTLTASCGSWIRPGSWRGLIPAIPLCAAEMAVFDSRRPAAAVLLSRGSGPADTSALRQPRRRAGRP
jgi:hypothetical protein